MFTPSYGLQRWLLMRSTTFMTSTESLEQWEGHWVYLLGSHSCNACCSSWAVSVISVRSDRTHIKPLLMCWIVCREIYVVMSAIFLHLQKVWNKMCVFLFSPMYKLILELKADHKLKMLWKFFGLAWLKACQNTIIIQIHYPLSKQQTMKYWIMLLCYNGSFGRFNNSLIMKLSI